VAGERPARRARIRIFGRGFDESPVTIDSSRCAARSGTLAERSVMACRIVLVTLRRAFSAGEPDRRGLPPSPVARLSSAISASRSALRFASRSASRWTAASSSAVLPTPPGPVTVVNGVNGTLSITSAISRSLPTSRRGRNAAARWLPCWVPTCPSVVPPGVTLAVSQACSARARAPGAGRDRVVAGSGP
jgi:hypothetical protein